MNTKLEDTILQAIDIIASKKITSAGYDKTIQATIVSCVDATIGKYKVKYQDSYLYAYSSNINTSFPNGTNVFILVPQGDMNKDKTILGTTKKLGINYITMAEGDQKFTPIGTNVIVNNNTFELCSYITSTKILYSKTYSSNQNLIQINNVEEYLKKSSHITLGMNIRTDLSIQQQYQGNYGILLGLDFIDNATQQEVTRYYSVDVDIMTGNPYRFKNKVRQYGMFDIDSSNFLRVNVVSLFVKDFPVQDNNKSSDIFISDLELCGANALLQDEIEGSALVLLTPKGYIFNANSAETDTRIIQAQVRVKGKTVDLNSQPLPIYWFIQNIGISSRDQKYNKYGGQGWECLNSYNIISPAVRDASGIVTNPAVVDFVPGKSILTIKKSDVLAKNVKYKCIVVYQNTVLSKEITIVNNDANYNFFIESDKGTQFYYDSGNPTLTCRCQQKNSSGSYIDMSIANLKFIWSMVNNVGSFESLPNTDQYNADQAKLQLLYNSVNDYLKYEYLLYQQTYDVNRVFPTDSTIATISDATKRSRVQTIRNNLRNGGLTSGSIINSLLNKYNVSYSGLTYRVFLNGSNSLSNALKIYTTTQRVNNNQIIGLNVKNITNFATYKCSIFSKTGNTFLGTASIVLTNTLQGESLYSLVINNGVQVFKYNTHGIAPTSKQNQIPYIIPALTFTVYDNLGNPIDDDVIKNGEISWIVPTENSMLKVSGYSGFPDSSSTKMIYKGLMSFSYGIEERFNVNKTNNNIQLKVNYKGLNLFAKTDLSFTKEGASGTNGTDFVCKIVPNVTSGSTPLYPTIYYNGSNISFNYNTNATKWFKVELWHNGGTPIYSGYASGNSTENKFVTILKWEVLKNTYSSTITDRTNFNIGTDGTCSFIAGTLSGSWNENNYKAWRAANIIKVTISYDGYTYYGTLPVIVVRTFNSSYRVNLKENTGFREALYTSSGINPSFDNHAPFEILVEQNTSGGWQDVSNKTTSDYKVSYAWYYMASVYRRVTASSWSQDIENTNADGSSSNKWLMRATTTGELKECQKAIKPADNYDGECVNTAIACRVYKGSTTIAWIHIPIHMLRNRFENSAINGWDGNTVDLGDQNGGTILAPQVGAGIKDSNNKFTGIVIGTAKDPKQAISGEINNTGDGSQGRFAAADQDVGLFGYHEGSRSIFLDAKTGKAVFGQSGQAQIVLDPSTTGPGGRKIAKIQSGNYSTSAKTGMLIDLTTPEIRFGSGNFSVDASGSLIAKGGGTIAGWNISDYQLWKDSTGMNSVSIAGATGSNTKAVKLPPTASGTAYRTQNKAAAFWAGTSKFYVTHDGYLRVEQATVGSGSSPIYIGKNGSTNSAIFSGLKSGKAANASGFYLGVDGIGIGSTSANIPVPGGGTATVSNFQVDSDGTLYARKGYIGNGRNGWLIQSTSLQNNKSNFNDKTYDRGVYIGVDGISLGRLDANTPAFSVDSAGNLITKKGQIANWTITKDYIAAGTDSFYGSTGMYFGVGGLRLGDHFSVDPNGNLRAENGDFQGKIVTAEGQIADWVISPGRIYRSGAYGDTFISANSGIKVGGFQVDNRGHLQVGTPGGRVFTVNANDGSITIDTGGYGSFSVESVKGTLTLQDGGGNVFSVNTTGELNLNGKNGSQFGVDTAGKTFQVGKNFVVDTAKGTLTIKNDNGGSFVVDATNGKMSFSASDTTTGNKFTIGLSTGDLRIGNFHVNDAGELTVGPKEKQFSVNAANGSLKIGKFAVSGNDDGTLTIGDFKVNSKNGTVTLRSFKVDGDDDGSLTIKGFKVDGKRGTLSLTDNFRVDENGNATFKGTVKIENGNSTAKFNSATIRGGTFGGGSGGGGPTFASGNLAQDLGITGSSHDLKHWISDELIVEKVTAKFINSKFANFNDWVGISKLKVNGSLTFGSGVSISFGSPYGGYSSGVSAAKAGFYFNNGICVHTPNKGELKADDSDKLDGHEASYFAQATDVSASAIKKALGIKEDETIATTNWVGSQGYLKSLPRHSHGAGSLSAPKDGGQVTGSTDSAGS